MMPKQTILQVCRGKSFAAPSVLGMNRSAMLAEMRGMMKFVAALVSLAWHAHQ